MASSWLLGFAGGWCLITGLDYWTGLLDWTTGLTFNHKISISSTVLTTKNLLIVRLVQFFIGTHISTRGHPLGPSQLGGGLIWDFGFLGGGGHS